MHLAIPVILKPRTTINPSKADVYPCAVINIWEMHCPRFLRVCYSLAFTELWSCSFREDVAFSQFWCINKLVNPLVEVPAFGRRQELLSSSQVNSKRGSHPRLELTRKEHPWRRPLDYRSLLIRILHWHSLTALVSALWSSLPLQHSGSRRSNQSRGGLPSASAPLVSPEKNFYHLKDRHCFYVDL